LPYKFWPSSLTAEQQAFREAADTGGVVLRVKSLRVEPKCLVITGLIPSAILVLQNPSELSSHLQPRSTGNLHLTWSSLLHPAVCEEVGYLVLQTPVAVASLLSESEDADFYWVALAIERTFHTLPPGSLGAVCCARCNRPISRERLLAVPGTRVCIGCQQKKEKNNDRSKQ